MNRKPNTRLLLFLLLAALVPAMAACGGRIAVGETQTKEETVARQDASEVEVQLRMGAGELNVSGGSQQLLEAAFTYNVEAWEPVLEYDVSAGTGRLTVTQPEVAEIGIPNNDIRYEWDLRLSEEMPLEMRVDLGAGQNNLNLAGLNLRSLRMNTGAGEVDVNLGGALETLRMETGAGEINLNLANRWEQDMEAQISGGIGSVTVLLPSDVGARVTVRQGIGSVNADGLTRSGDTYTNDAYGESEVTLDITIEGGIGEVNLRVGG